MQYVNVARASFSAAHRLPDANGHSENHGHVYHVTVHEETRFDKTTEALARDPEELQAALRKILVEFDRRDLNIMLVGAPPTLAAIASQILERLALEHAVTSCAVHENGGPEVVVSREIRK